MKKIQFLFVLLAALYMGSLQAQTSETMAVGIDSFSNPLNVQLGDPYVLHSQGTYYMYGTGAGADHGFAAYSSKDLVNWKHEGQVYFHDNKKWLERYAH